MKFCNLGDEKTYGIKIQTEIRFKIHAEGG